MAITDEDRNEIISLVVGMLNAAPGSEDLVELVAQFESGATLLDLANTIATGDDYTSIYPTELSNAEWAARFLDNVLGNEVSDTDKLVGVSLVSAELDSGSTRPQVAVVVMDFLYHHTEEDAWFAAAEAVRNKVAVASHYAVTLDLQPHFNTDLEDLQHLQDVIDDVDSSADSITAAIGDIPNIVRYRLMVSDVSRPEGDSGTGQMNFTLTLDAGALKDVTIDYSTTNVSAEAGSDYTPLSDQVIFTLGQSSATVSVTVIGDTELESNETFLVSFQGSLLVSDESALGTIIDDELPAFFNLADLDGTNGFRLDGVNAVDRSGFAVSGAGDVNNDGYDDLIVGAFRSDPNGNNDSGSSYVVFGKESGFAATLNLASLDGSNGFRLDGVSTADFSGYQVSDTGDVNGDGNDDLIVGAWSADNNGFNSGSSYVVFGKDGSFDSVIELADLDGTDGFRLDGAGVNDMSGRSVSSAGDVNHDGVDDLIIGANAADPNGTDPGNSDAGSSYVVFGKLGGFGAMLNLGSLDGTNGFRLDGFAGNDQAGYSVSGAGDVNHDGVDDLIIGAYRADPNGTDSGSSYVVFGKTGGFEATLNLGSLDGTNGFRLDGEGGGDFSGASVSGAGDVNGDGIDDVIVGANNADPGGRIDAGSSYVVFGKTGGFEATLNLGSLDGTNGFRLEGVDEYNFSGISVKGAGDVNNDGIADVIVGAYQADPKGESSVPGASYVVFGKADGFAASLNLANLNGTNGFRLDGVSAADSTGLSVSSAGDVNGDGNDDLIVGADWADPNGSQSGSSYVVFGKSSSPGILLEGGPGDDSLAGGAGNDTLIGSGGRDTLEGFAGDDELDGGDDIDHALFQSDLVDFAISKGEHEIIVSGPASDGMDTLDDVERLRFDDMSLAFDLDGNAGMIAKLLGVVLGKDNWYNKEYVGIGLDLLDNSVISFESLMDLAIEVVLGANATNTQVVTLFYTNLFDQGPSQGELNELVGLIGNGTYTQASFGVAAANHEMNLENIDFVGLINSGIEYFAL